MSSELALPYTFTYLLTYFDVVGCVTARKGISAMFRAPEHLQLRGVGGGHSLQGQQTSGKVFSSAYALSKLV